MRDTTVIIILVAFLCVVITLVIMSAQEYEKEINIRSDCRLLCKIYSMDYEGVKDGLCACTSNLGVREYVSLGD